MGSPPHTRGTTWARAWARATHRDHPRIRGDHPALGPVASRRSHERMGQYVFSDYLEERLSNTGRQISQSISFPGIRNYQVVDFLQFTRTVDGAPRSVHNESIQTPVHPSLDCLFEDGLTNQFFKLRVTPWIACH